MEEVYSKIKSMDTDLSERFIITACEDSMLRLFMFKDKALELLSEMPGHSGVVTKALFINQGELIASSDFNGNLIIWKSEGYSFSKKIEISVQNGPIYDISTKYSNDTLTVFCGCDNGKLKTVKFDQTFKYEITEQEVHKYGIISVDCYNDYIVTGSTDCSVALLKGDNVEQFDMHRGSVNGVCISPRSDEKTIVFATCSEDGKVFIIEKTDTEIKKQEFVIGEPCYQVDWNRAGFVLTVSYGSNGYKSFAINDMNDYVEIPMESQ